MKDPVTKGTQHKDILNTVLGYDFIKLLKSLCFVANVSNIAHGLLVLVLCRPNKIPVL